MKVFQITVGPLEENCYLFANEKGHTLIIDPGAEGERIQAFIEEKKLIPQAIVLTHAHCDHIGAVDFLRDQYRIPLYMNQIERDFLTDADQNLSRYFGEPLTVRPAEFFFPAKLGKMTIGDFEMILSLVPGHSPGSTILHFPAEKLVFGGDVLFSGGVGRTDFPQGNLGQLLEEIHEQLLPLPDQTLILPGHGPATTIGAERVGNPFLAQR